MPSSDVRQHIEHLKKLVSGLDDKDLEINRLNEELSYRLLVLTQPPGDLGGLKLLDVIDLSLLQKIQDQFSESYDVASVIYNEHGEVITKPSNFSDFCLLLRTSEIGLQRCNESKEHHYKMTVQHGRPVLDVCRNFKELLDGSIPLFVGKRRVGTWCCGQRKTKVIPRARVEDYAKKIGLDPDTLYLAYQKLKIGSVPMFQLAIKFLNTLCETLSLLGLQNIQQAQCLLRQETLENKLEEIFVKDMCRGKNQTRRASDSLWKKD